MSMSCAMLTGGSGADLADSVGYAELLLEEYKIRSMESRASEISQL